MTKIYILFLLMLFSFGFSQTYQFDFLTKYSSKDEKSQVVRETVSYNNTDDFSYYLKLRKGDSDFTATIYDHKRNLAHNFSVVESKQKGEIIFQFRYENSGKLASSSYARNYRYEFSEIPEESLKVVSLKIYTSKRAKKPASEKILTLKKADKNLIPLFRSEWLHLYSDYLNVQDLGNYIVSKAIEKYKVGTCESVLEEYKNVDFTIELPKKLKL